MKEGIGEEHAVDAKKMAKKSEERLLILLYFGILLLGMVVFVEWF